jgi:hypothetical protein
MKKNKEPAVVDKIKNEETIDLGVDSIEMSSPHLTLKSNLSKKERFKNFLRTKKGKAIAVILVVAVICAVIFGIPASRYGILGMVIKKDVKVSVSDDVTKKPVSGAEVTLGAVMAKTDAAGIASLKNVPVGNYNLKVEKKYYKPAETAYTVPVIFQQKDTNMQVNATGRQVTVSLVDTITQAALANATLTVKDTSAVSDDKGHAVIVLPADKESLKGRITHEGYNDTEVDVKVTEQTDANKFTVTPSGNVFYLSKQTGKINVMKAHLDGKNAETIIEGTGNENDRETVLLAARDWKYMALSAKRDDAKENRIYLINASTGKLSTIDEGNAAFRLIGWSGHQFIYHVTRANENGSYDKREVLKAYNAETGKLSILDEATGQGTNSYDYQSEYFGDPYILEGKLIYAKVWTVGSWAPKDKKSAIVVVNLANGQKQRVKEFSMNNYISLEAKLYEPQEVYFRVSTDGGKGEYFEYEGNSIKSVTNTDEKFYNSFYPTYLISPDGKKTFWYEPRDGKNVLFVGDSNGANSEQLAEQSEYTSYGWYTDKYILLSKNGSELFIAPSDKTFGGNQPIKITNYHKPSLTFPGYGYGYGGQ